MKLFLRSWLPTAVTIIALGGLVYAAGQQVLRLSANDPQIQLARDAARQLDSPRTEAPLPSPVSAQTVDIGLSLAPYLIIFDSRGGVSQTSAKLDDKTPVPPTGVFANVRDHGEEQFTWEPKPGVRQAAVVVPFKDGFVLAGRSLLEVEKREDTLFELTALATLIILGSSAAFSLFLRRN